MGEYFPLLVAVAALIYRIYTNFLKEQEKARKRNPSQVPDTYAPAERHETIEFPAKEEYTSAEEYPEETYYPQKPYEPVASETWPEYPAVETYKEPKYEPVKYQAPVIPQYKEDKASEVRIGKSIQTPERITITEDPEQEELRSAYADLDMHDAVIKSAILNRPEY